MAQNIEVKQLSVDSLAIGHILAMYGLKTLNSRNRIVASNRLSQITKPKLDICRL